MVSPSEPRTQGGGYWGYNVRLAESLTDVLSASPYPGGYDVTIATSAHGTPLDSQPPIKPFRWACGGAEAKVTRCSLHSTTGTC